MENSPFIKTTDFPEDVIRLLETTTLGSNGARYRLLSTRQRIKELDDPVNFTLRRSNDPLANVTFCRRGKNWYLRYFAFHPKFQSNTSKKAYKSNVLKDEINSVFQNNLNNHAHCLYAYIEPKNVRSGNQAEQFGLKPEAEIVTQLFSRLKPKESAKHLIESYSDLQQEIQEIFGNQLFFHSKALESCKFHCLRNENGSLLAFCRVTAAAWKIERLPGKFGGLFTKLIPSLPIMKQYIVPAKHEFMVADTVYTANNSSVHLQELFESILNIHNKKIIHWWTDLNSKLYKTVSPKIKWGLLDKIMGKNKVNLVYRSNSPFPSGQEIYVNGTDMV
jgi:hypothetical protein